MDNKKEFKKCPRCKTYRTLETFYNTKGRLLKTCSICRDTEKKYRQKNKCLHGRQKAQCKECGTGYCQHNRLKHRCKDCGSGYCEHKRIKGNCKYCNNPVKITIKRWINKSKQTDKKKKQYDRCNFIDRCFLNNLVDDIKKCIYCKCVLVYEGKRHPNLATIERINNNKGHVKSNCTLACYKCNITRGNRQTHEEYKYKFVLKELLNKTTLIN
jgi:hypothetical protein